MKTVVQRPPADANPFHLRRKVVHALVGVFLVFVTTRAALMWWEHNQTFLAEQRRVENLAHVLAEHLNRTFGAIESAVNQLAVHSDRIGGPRAPREEWSQVLDATLSGLSAIGSLNILDEDGVVILSTNPAVTGTSRRGLYLHRRLKDEPSSNLVIGPAVPAEHISGVRIPVGRALQDSLGKFTGFVAATFQPERLRGFYETINVGPRGVIQLLHLDGELLFTQPRSSQLSADSIGNQAILAASRSGITRGFLHAPINSDGATYLTAWRSLSSPSLVVAVSIPERDVFSAWNTELVTVILSAAGMAIMLAVAGFWITTSSREHARAAAERDRVGAALHRNQVQLQAIIDHSPSGIVLKDRSGRYLLANRTVQQWFGLPLTAILGRMAFELLSEDEARGAVDQDHQVATAGEVVVRERDVKFPDGVPRKIITTKFPVRLEGRETICVGDIMTDVTSSREAEERLRQAQKMEAVGQLTGGVAHDFNNLLTAILGNLDLIKDRTDGDAVTNRYLDVAMRAGRRGSELTHRLLAFARRQPIAPVITDVNDLIVECKSLLQRTIGAAIDIDIRLGEDAWPALVDRNQLENVLLNLAINARDAMCHRGKLTIETANVTLDAAYASRNPDAEPGWYVMIAVSDTGSGMEPEVLGRAFEPFFTTKPHGQGTGLGLSMVYGFAKQSGGHIKIYSEFGQGTTIKLYLPRAAGAEVDSVDQAPSGAEELPGGTETILVVEDDSDVAAFTTVALASLGYQVVRASDGQSTLDQLRELSRLDLLVTDVVLPNGMNGREVADKACEAFPNMKVLFISGYAESIIVHQGRLEEGVNFLPKPFAKEDLARKVRASLDGHGQTQAGMQ